LSLQIIRLPEKYWQRGQKMVEHEIALFRTLDCALLDAFEEAKDLGLLQGWDQTIYDVPSVAPHPQNAYRSGFYPITRVLADVWLRVASRDGDRARTLVQHWRNSPFTLVRRLMLFALANAVFSPKEATEGVLQLDDRIFWVGAAQVEIMRILVERWTQFSDADRHAIEARLRQGIPRNLYGHDVFEDDEEWISIKDSSIYRRLTRICQAGGALTIESRQLIAEISARHPTWRPSPGDRDDFHFWHETHTGPEGNPELLANIADDQLVREGMRLQRERNFEQGDVWRLFCSADPERALRGLRIEAGSGQWDPEPWRCLLGAASEKGDIAFQCELANQLQRMPDDPLRELLPAATSWLQRRRKDLLGADQPRGPQFLTVWDHFADLAFAAEAADPTQDWKDLITESLNRPGGVLAWSLQDQLVALKPQWNNGVDSDLKPRFDRLMAAPGRPGLLARVYLARSLAYFDAIDPDWVETTFQPRLAWSHPEALPLWRSYANGRIGSARLFNALKPAILAAFERKELADHEFEGLVSNLLSIMISHQQGEAAEYILMASEVRRALTVGPPAARRNIAWNLWRLMDGTDENGEGENDTDLRLDPPTRWRKIIGPIFHKIWPLDAGLRSRSTSEKLVLMALECGDAFPEAVEAILDVIIPYQLYGIAHSLRLEQKHSDLVRRHPLAFVRLANALIDPASFPVPNDLGQLLDECVAVDAAVAQDSAYQRLSAISRQRSA
jgi:hypothetical protein